MYLCHIETRALTASNYQETTIETGSMWTAETYAGVGADGLASVRLSKPSGLEDVTQMPESYIISGSDFLTNFTEIPA